VSTEVDWRARAELAEARLAEVVKALEPEMRCAPETVVEAVTRTVRFAMGCRQTIALERTRAERAEGELAGAFGDDSYRDAWSAIIGVQRHDEPILDTVRRLVRTADHCWQNRMQRAAEDAGRLANQLKGWSEEL